MSEKILKQNYKLLKLIAKDILVDDEPKFMLKHETEWIGKSYCIYGASVKKIDNNHIQLCTFYNMKNFSIAPEGKFTRDPEMTILFNNELKIARISKYYIDNPNVAFLLNGTNVYEKNFNCTEKSKETKDEVDLNLYLYEWLEDYVETIKIENSFFSVIPINNKK